MATGFFLPLRFKIGGTPVAVQAGFTSMFIFWLGGGGGTVIGITPLQYDYDYTYRYK